MQPKRKNGERLWSVSTQKMRRDTTEGLVRFGYRFYKVRIERRIVTDHHTVEAHRKMSRRDTEILNRAIFYGKAD